MSKRMLYVLLGLLVLLLSACGTADRSPALSVEETPPAVITVVMQDWQELRVYVATPVPPTSTTTDTPLPTPTDTPTDTPTSTSTSTPEPTSTTTETPTPTETATPIPTLDLDIGTHGWGYAIPLMRANPQDNAVLAILVPSMMRAVDCDDGPSFRACTYADMVAVAGNAGPTHSHLDSVRAYASNAAGANLLGYVPEGKDTAPGMPPNEADPAQLPAFALEFSGIGLEHPDLTLMYGVGISLVCVQETYEPHRFCDLDTGLISAISANLLDGSIWALRVNTLESIYFDENTGQVDEAGFRAAILEYITAIHAGNPGIRIVMHLTLKPRAVQADSVERFMIYANAVQGLVESVYAGIDQPSSWDPNSDEEGTLAALQELLWLTGAGDIVPPTQTPTPAPTQAAQVIKDLPYGEDPRHVLDLYLPAGPGPFPVVAWFHGGGGTSGDKSMITDQALLLNASGLAVAAANYRYVTSDPLPAQIHDAKAVIRFLRYHAAEYRLDPDRIGAAGGSAGAIIASTLATSNGLPELEGTVGDLEGLVSSDVQAGVILAGVYDWQAYYAAKWAYCLAQSFDVPECWTDNDKTHFFGCYLSNEACRNRLILSGAITHVTAGDPPISLWVGERDETPRALPDHQAFLAALLSAGVPAELWIETDDACDTHGNMWPCIADLVLQWILEHLL